MSDANAGPEPARPQDRGEVIAAALSSAEWEQKLAAARVAREKALAAKRVAATVAEAEQSPPPPIPMRRPPQIQAKTPQPATPRVRRARAAAAGFGLGALVGVLAVGAGGPAAVSLFADAKPESRPIRAQMAKDVTEVDFNERVAADVDAAAFAAVLNGRRPAPPLPSATEREASVIVIESAALAAAKLARPAPVRPASEPVARQAAFTLASIAPTRPAENQVQAYAAATSEGPPEADGAPAAKLAPAEMAPLPPVRAESAAEPPGKPASLDRVQRREAQRRLTLLGFDTQGVDGVFGPNTRSAISAWQQAAGFAATGRLSDRHHRALHRESDARYTAWLEEMAARRNIGRAAPAARADGCATDGAGRIIKSVSFRCDFAALRQVLTR